MLIARCLSAGGVVVLLVTGASGQTVSPQPPATQSAPPPPADDPKPPAPPSLRVMTSVRRLFTTPLSTASELTVLTTPNGRIDLRGQSVTSSADWSSSHGMAGFGPMWKVGGDLVFHARGGLTFIAGASGRRGYSLPSYASTLPDGSSIFSAADARNAATSRRPVLFETRFAIEKPLVRRGQFSATAVAEALNMFNLNKPIKGELLPPAFTSKAYRFGVLVKF
ncbi:MAG TPA: hypothetical protein VF147_12650 [Vicinamibacterales bacterium]